MGIVKQSKIRRLRDETHPIFYFNSVVATHKIDGTNSRIMWDSNEEEFYLGSKNRKWPLESDQDNQGFAQWAKDNVDFELIKEHFETVDITILGEFFKNSILGRVEYGDEGRFRVFDVHINNVFLDWADVVDVANKLNLKPVPYEVLDNFDKISLQEKTKGTDPLACEKASEARSIKEGLVVRPPKEFSYKGDRCIVKVKSDRFSEVHKSTSNKKSKEKEYDNEEVKKVNKYITKARIEGCVNTLIEKHPDKYTDEVGNVTISVRDTGDVIKEVLQDIRDEADKDLDDKTLGKIGGGIIASRFHILLDTGAF